MRTQSKDKWKRWDTLKEVIGACSLCIHEGECEPFKKHVEDKYLNGKYVFTCPILVELRGKKEK